MRVDQRCRSATSTRGRGNTQGVGFGSVTPRFYNISNQPTPGFTITHNSLGNSSRGPRLRPPTSPRSPQGGKSPRGGVGPKSARSSGDPRGSTPSTTDSLSPRDILSEGGARDPRAVGGSGGSLNGGSPQSRGNTQGGVNTRGRGVTFAEDSQDKTSPETVGSTRNPQGGEKSKEEASLEGGMSTMSTMDTLGSEGKTIDTSGEQYSFRNNDHGSCDYISPSGRAVKLSQEGQVKGEFYKATGKDKDRLMRHYLRMVICCHGSESYEIEARKKMIDELSNYATPPGSCNNPSELLHKQAKEGALLTKADADHIKDAIDKVAKKEGEYKEIVKNVLADFATPLDNYYNKELLKEVYKTLVYAIYLDLFSDEEITEILDNRSKMHQEILPTNYLINQAKKVDQEGKERFINEITTLLEDKYSMILQKQAREKGTAKKKAQEEREKKAQEEREAQEKEAQEEREKEAQEKEAQEARGGGSTTITTYGIPGAPTVTWLPPIHPPSTYGVPATTATSRTPSPAETTRSHSPNSSRTASSHQSTHGGSTFPRLQLLQRPVPATPASSRGPSPVPATTFSPRHHSAPPRMITTPRGPSPVPPSMASPPNSAPPRSRPVTCCVGG